MPNVGLEDIAKSLDDIRKEGGLGVDMVTALVAIFSQTEVTPKQLIKYVISKNRTGWKEMIMMLALPIGYSAPELGINHEFVAKIENKFGKGCLADTDPDKQLTWERRVNKARDEYLQSLKQRARTYYHSS